MNFIENLQLLFNDCSNFCCFYEYETGKLIFMNQIMEKRLQIFDPYEGKNYLEVLSQYIAPQDISTTEEVVEGEICEKRVFCTALNAFLRSTTGVLNVEGRKLVVKKYFLTSLDEKRVDAQQSFDDAITRCLEIHALPDRDDSVQAFLTLLKDFYGCEMACLCEFDQTQPIMEGKCFWSSTQGVSRVPSQWTEQIPLDTFLDWVGDQRSKDIIFLDAASNFSEHSIEGGILKVFQCNNMIFNKLWSKSGNLHGIVGLSNCTHTLYDGRFLRAVAHFMIERFDETTVAEALEQLGEVDLLTGFYNRDRYAQYLEELEKNPPKSLGVLFVNLNGLRVTNEFLGYEKGDAQIKRASTMLSETFDCDFYRITGDEFIGFVPNVGKDPFEKEVNTLQNQLKTRGQEFNFSLGHSWAEGRYSAPQLVKIADTVMVVNKQEFYHQTLSYNSEKMSNALLQELFQALAEDEFLVYLQPQIDLNTQEVVGAEALIRRFSKKEQKMIFPDQFIPQYEQNSIIRHVDLFMIRRVCQILQDWGHVERSLPISVNLSRVTLMEHGIVQTISDILDEYHTPHELVIIEVTERIGLVENEVASNLVDEFKEKGFRLSLDDFGCAYSNIVTLAQIEVDEVKIDKSLVDNILTNSKNSVIVKNMLAMCRELEDTNTLAEGIETQEQADFLRSIRCQLGQGYLYSRPIPNEEFFQKYIK